MFILHTTPGALTGAWLILPLETATFPLRWVAVRLVPCMCFTTKAGQSGGDALTCASSCSFLAAAALYTWLSLAPEYPGPLLFVLGDSSTFSSCWHAVSVFRFPALYREKGLKTIRWKPHHVSTHRKQGSPYYKRKTHYIFVLSS